MALGGWTLARTFELSTIQAVHEDKVHKLEFRVEKLKDQIIEKPLQMLDLSKWEKKD